jgi:hypothetical protein
MNLGQRAVKQSNSSADSETGCRLESDADQDAGGRYHDRELRYIAAFRLRDAANRVATLVGLTMSSELRAELLAVYERLMDEERRLLLCSMSDGETKQSRTPPGRTRRGSTAP